MDSDTKRESAPAFEPVDTDHLRRVDTVVGAALDLPRDDRRQFLLEACGGDALLQRDAESLLASCEMAEASPNFLGGTAADLATPLMEDLLAQSAPSGTAMVPVLAAALGSRYTVVRAIGSGGAANVYLADDLNDGRQVAIKVLRPELAETTAATRFVREIRLMSTLEHPRIVPVLHAGEVAGVSYYILPYMDGRSLRDRLASEKQLPIAEALAIATALADALEYAHHRGMIHRDVKPENILFSGGDAHLADFGIARVLERTHGESSTTTGLVRGTVPYMSPEQASGNRAIDGRSDVYALGCVLYEMLSGMPAFAGPSPEAILAQKILHPPRDLTIYRPSISPRLSAVVMRALETTPADRWRSAGAFAAALRSLTPDDWSVTNPPPSRWRGHWRRRAVLAGLAATALIITSVIAASSAKTWLLRRNLTRQSPDTTIIAVLPLERGAQARARPLDDDQLLRDAMAWWRGVVLVDRFLVSDALRRHGPNLTSREASSVASSLGAGRYVRGTITPQGNAWRVYAALFDLGQPGALRQASEMVSDSLAPATAAYARLSRALLVRDAEADSLGADVAPTQSLPAAQALGRAQVALDAWDLVAADSAFDAAVRFDPGYARASLLLAQVRAWRSLPAASWASLANRANANARMLSSRESQLAVALSALGNANYQEACSVYDHLRRRNERDFAAWYGLGMCRSMDHGVIPDSTSLSGWRFRSSYHSALSAYSTAFEILPSVHRGYERGAFEEVLRIFVFVGNEVMFGRGVDRDSALFQGWPVWVERGDSLVIIPYPWRSVATSFTPPPGFGQALEHLRPRFRKIAAGWSAAYSASAGAKQAVAISLDLDGDARAIDTMSLARRLASDSQRKIQLGAAEVLLRVKFGTPSDVQQLAAARLLAESLLTTQSPTPTEAQVLAPVASLTGHCDRAAELARLTPVPSYRVPVANDVAIDAQVVLVRSTLGCPEGPSSPRLADVAKALARDPAAARLEDRQYLDTRMLFRPVLYATPLDSVLIDRVAGSAEHPLLQAARALTRHDASRVRSTLSEIHDKTRVTSAPSTPDMEFVGASLLLAVADTADSRKWLDALLEQTRSFNPSTLRDPARSAAFVRATVLRADLAMAARDSIVARRWAVVAATLWRNADPALQGVARRMARYAALP